MNKKTASENLQYIQSKEYKDMKDMFPLDDTADNKQKNPDAATKTSAGSIDTSPAN